MMNELEFAKKIARHLDEGASALSQPTLARLQSARAEALAHYRAAKPVFGLAWAGHATLNRGAHGLRFWLPVAALLLALAGTLYWQSTQQESEVADDVDASLLAGELPVHAYLDKDFNAWLASSEQ